MGTNKQGVLKHKQHNNQSRVLSQSLRGHQRDQLAMDGEVAQS